MRTHFEVEEWYGRPLSLCTFGGAWTSHAAGEDKDRFFWYFLSITLLYDKDFKRHFARRFWNIERIFGTVG